MSKKILNKNENIERIIEKIKRATGLKTDRALAEKLGYTSTGTISNWKSEGRIEWEKIRRAFPYLDFNDLMSDEINAVNDKIVEYESRQVGSKEAGSERAILLEWILSRSESLSEEHRLLADAIRKLIDIDSK